MNLALRDIRHHAGRFAGTALGMSLLFTVVLSMAGIYEGLVADATSLARTMRADLWVVQRGTVGPFADTSRVDPSLEARVAAVPGVTSARSYSYLVVQRNRGAQPIRMALVGLAWPEDRGAHLPLVAGRPLAQPHGEIVVDLSVGLGIGEQIRLGNDDYTVVGLTRHAVTTGGDGAAFLSLADSLLVQQDEAAEAILTERERRRERLRVHDLGRTQPQLASLVVDPRWRAPVLAAPPVQAVLVQVAGPHAREQVRRVIGSWADVSVYDQQQEEDLLILGVVQKARLQLGMFSVILILTSSVVFASILYNMTLDKTHDIAVLKLMGAGRLRISALVLQQAWLLGLIGYGLAVVIGTLAFPHFPRRVVLTDAILVRGAALVAVVATLSSVLGVVHGLRVEAGRVLEG
jgi:putative ABC transport system permease protein